MCCRARACSAPRLVRGATARRRPGPGAPCKALIAHAPRAAGPDGRDDHPPAEQHDHALLRRPAAAGARRDRVHGRDEAGRAPLHRPGPQVRAPLQSRLRGPLSARACACSGGRRPSARAARRCPEYTNPTDFFMGLMKDDATAGTLADVWRKRYEGMVASAPPLPVAPISKRAVADDPTLAPGPEGYADGYKAEAFESAHSALEVRAQLSRCAVALCRRALPACLAVTGRKRAGARERGARSCDECRGGHTPAGEQRGARARAERRPVPDAGAVRPERPGNGRQGRSQPARGRPPQGLQRPRGARAGRQPRRQRRGCGPRPGRLAAFRSKVWTRARICALAA